MNATQAKKEGKNHERRWPLFEGILPFDKSRLIPDIVAGITLAAIAIPEVMGYTKISGTPMITGLYTMLVGALGCNLAWGIIDAVLYLMGCMAEKSWGLMRFQAVRNTTDAQEAQRLIADGLWSAMNAILQPAELASMHQRLKQLPGPPKRMHLRKEDWLGALCRVVGG